MPSPDISILAIDTSCDDTSVAVLKNDCVLSSIVSSQEDVHKAWGGVVPLLAKRAHEEVIEVCLDLALQRARIPQMTDLSAVAATYGPGLAPALEVGIGKAKQLAKAHCLPLIAVNHMEGHLLSPLLKNRVGKYFSKREKIELPWLSLIISGGHTEIVWVEKIGEYKIIGKTLDDAAGEALDKVARMLGLGYPGGAVIEKMAMGGDPKKYKLPRPMQKSDNYDFSFSGLKTACLYSTNSLKEELKDEFSKIVPDYCASFQQAVVDCLLTKLMKAVRDYRPKTVLVGGGVSVNNHLRKEFRLAFQNSKIPLYFPYRKFCMDNAAMIGLAAYHQYARSDFVPSPENLDRVPNLSLER